MQKFKGHYKQAVSLKKSGCMDNNLMPHAYVIWKEDELSDFDLEYAWQLLKDQPKWLLKIALKGRRFMHLEHIHCHLIQKH